MPLSILNHSLFEVGSVSVEHAGVFLDQLRNLHVADKHTPLLVSIDLGAIQRCPLLGQSASSAIVRGPPLLSVPIHSWWLFSNIPFWYPGRIVSHLHRLVIPWP